ncbi:MAG: accessory factor UbiK family protein [Hyphomicrobiales bacterium]
MSTGSARFFDDLARVMTSAAGAAQGVRNELDTLFRTQAERVLNELDVVQRDEFDAVREMAIKAREENDALKEQISALEAKIDGMAPKKRAPARKKPTAKKAAPKKS